MLRQLGLPRAAARLFTKVAALSEPGWALEAARESEHLLRQAQRADDDWKVLQAAVRKLVHENELPSGELVQAQPNVLRSWFYLAIWSADTPQTVWRLLPLARTLDEYHGGTALEAQVRRAAASDFRRRAPAARLFGRLLTASSSAHHTEIVQLLLEQADDPAVADIVLGALADTGLAKDHLAVFARLAASLADPWFDMVEAENRWQRAMDDGQYEAAVQAAKSALGRCDERKLALHWVALAGRMSRSQAALYRLPEADKLLQQALTRARQGGFVVEEVRLLRTAADIEGRRFGAPLARAYFEEIALSEMAPCFERRAAREFLAKDALSALEPEAAAWHIARTKACGPGQPALTSAGIAVAAALRRFPGVSVEREKVETSLAVLDGIVRPIDRALVEMTRGFWLASEAPHQAEQRFRDALRLNVARREAGVETEFIERGSSVELALAAASAGHWSDAFSWVMRATGVATPGTGCVLAFVRDGERDLGILRRPDGSLLGQVSRRAAPPLPPRTGELDPPVLNSAIAGQMRDCQYTAVAAPPQQRVWARWVVGDVAWSYLARPATAGQGPVPPPATSSPPRRLVVMDPEAPPDLGLPRLYTPLQLTEGTRVLRGLGARPSRVLAELAVADLVEFHVHGVANASVSEETALVLSPDPDGQFLFTRARLAGLTLPRRPVVILAACRGASGPTARQDTAGLTEAFLRAGARMVFASLGTIPDVEADTFFSHVRELVAGGRPAAVALQEARRAWRRRASDSWVDSVAAFE